MTVEENFLWLVIREREKELVANKSLIINMNNVYCIDKI